MPPTSPRFSTESIPTSCQRYRSGLIAAHGAHHVLQINQYKKKEYAKLEETWSIMLQHVYVIADTLMTALAKQFPARFRE